MKRNKKLNYRFHDPNPPEVAAEYILKVFIEVNKPKVERAVREAKECAAGISNAKIKEKMV